MPGITNHDLTQEKVSGCLILQVWPLRIHRVPKAAMWSSLSGGETNLLLLYDQGFGEIQLFPQVRDASWGNAGGDWIEQYVGFLAEGQGILWLYNCLKLLHRYLCAQDLLFNTAHQSTSGDPNGTEQPWRQPLAPQPWLGQSRGTG